MKQIYYSINAGSRSFVIGKIPSKTYSVRLNLGIKGDMPTKGKDYWTEEDQQSILSEFRDLIEPDKQEAREYAERAETAKTETLEAKDIAIQTKEETLVIKDEAINAKEGAELAKTIAQDTVDGMVNGAEVDDEHNLWLLHDGERIIGPISGVGGGGGGGGSSNPAKLEARNTSGFIKKTISDTQDCFLTFTWSSKIDEEETGDGKVTVKVDGVAVDTINISQGEVSINVKDYLKSSEQKIRFTIQDAYENTTSLYWTINVISVKIESSFDGSAAYSGDINYFYTPTGDVEKTIHFIVDDVEIGTEVITSSGRQLSYVIPSQTHGSHTLDVYFTAVINESPVESNHLFYDLICVVEGNTTPIVSSTFRVSSMEQYFTEIVPYQVYDPQRIKAKNVVIYVDDEPIQNLTDVDRTVHYFDYSPEFDGIHSIKIECGSSYKEFTINVRPSSINILPVDTDLELYLTSKNRSNNEPNKEEWSYQGISATFSNFNWTTDGWMKDEDNYPTLRIFNDDRVTIPFKPFEEDFRQRGKTIEFEFSTHDIFDYNSTILSCWDDANEVGFKITPQKVILKSAQSEIETQFKEDEHIRVSFVVSRISNNRIIYCYINGIISGAIQYPSDDDFSQLSPKSITLGSNDATLDVYNIRVYNRDLTMYEMLQNYIADTQNGVKRYNIFKRNDMYDIYDNIVIDKLPKDLPYMILDAPSLPNFKDDVKTINVEYVDPQYSNKSFTSRNVLIDVQGTSSQFYPRKNYDLKFKNGGFVNSTGQSSPKYQLREDSIPVDRFVLKADYASSEGANNVELTRYYNDICPAKTPAQLDNPLVRQGIDGFPIVVFQRNGNTLTFLGKYNFNNAKGNDEVYGFSGDDDQSIEMLNNTSNRVIFKNDDFSTDAWKNDFEFRYPKEGDITDFASFVSWVKSTNRDEEGLTEEEKKARLNKFKTEATEWFDVDDAIFYYLFTELFLMVDSRAKNTFPTKYNNGKWMWLPYDMDTALGINNEGELKFNYNLEDIDLVHNKEVYNGQHSVFWNNLRDAFKDEIRSTYVSLRANGLSYDEIEKRFEEHQNKWSEAIFNEDAYYKYILPLVNNGENNLKMCLGSKEEQRKWWMFNRFRYIDSKYTAGDAKSQYINFRAYQSGDFTITPYNDIYVWVKCGSYEDSERATRNVPTTLHLEIDAADDTETSIYSADQLKNIGDLSVFHPGYCNVSKATRLQELKVGDAVDVNPLFTELTLDKNILLTKIDARNLPNLKSSVNASGCLSLKEAYFEGTGIPSLQLPEGGVLETLHLPSSITNLTIRNQMNITDFSVTNNDYSNITTLRLENVSDAVNEQIDEIIQSMPDNSRIRLIGFRNHINDYTGVTTFLNSLSNMRGIDEKGYTVEEPQLMGKFIIREITYDNLQALRAEYPNFNFEAEKLIYTVNFYNGDVLIKTELVTKGGDATYSGETPTKTQDAQFTYTFNGWNRDSEAIEPDENALKNIQGNTNIYATYERTLRSYTVKFYNGDTVIQSSVVNYGTVPTYNGETPTKESTVSTVYTFDGWTPSLSEVTGDIDYYAHYEETLRTYTINFYNDSTGTRVLLETKQVGYGLIPTYTGETPIYGGTEEYGDFNGWTPSLSEVTGNSDYVAKFVSLSSVTRKFMSGTYTGELTTNATTVRRYGFSENMSPQRIILPNVEKISMYAFSGNVTTMEIVVGTENENVCVLERNSGLNVESIRVPDSLVENYKSSTNWSDLKSYIRGISEPMDASFMFTDGGSFTMSNGDKVRVWYKLSTYSFAKSGTVGEDTSREVGSGEENTVTLTGRIGKTYPNILFMPIELTKIVGGKFFIPSEGEIKEYLNATVSGGTKPTSNEYWTSSINNGYVYTVNAYDISSSLKDSSSTSHIMIFEKIN